MDNKEKSQEIADIYMPDTGFTREDLYDAAMEMARWKDEQLKEILKKKMNLFYPPIDDYNEGKLSVLKDLYQELFNEYYI